MMCRAVESSPMLCSTSVRRKEESHEKQLPGSKKCIDVRICRCADKFSKPVFMHLPCIRTFSHRHIRTFFFMFAKILNNGIEATY